MKKINILPFLAIILLYSCGGYKLSPILDENTIHGSYVGQLPCPDCKEINYRLDIRPDGLYVMEEAYVDNDGASSSFYYLGEYELGGGRLDLISNGQVKMKLGSIEGLGLSILNAAGELSDQPEINLLNKAPKSTLHERVMPVAGMLSKKNGQLILEECRVSKPFVLRLNPNTTFLEEEYSFAVKNEGEKVYTELIGSLTYGSNEILVSNVMVLSPSEGCK